MSNLPGFTSTPDAAFVPGYCLRADKRTEFVYHKDMFGSPFWCGFCGRITKDETPYHIWSPSEPLLKKLEGKP